MRGSTRTALLLIQLGTPASPRTADVRAYLREFLSDPRVIDVHPLKRWLLLNLIILRFRPRRSAEAYAQIWSDRGSPLMAHSRDLVARLQQRLGRGVTVGLAMRYGGPSIAAALEEFRNRGIDRVVAFPLYPQYSSATTGSSLEELYRCASALWNVPSIHVVPPFFDHTAFIEASAALARPYVVDPGVEKVFFSFHGLPERQLRKGDPTGDHCLRRGDCCDRAADIHPACYRAQCLTTARLLGDRLGLPAARRVVCFQSRLGREPWLRPYTDQVLEAEARGGTKRAVILSPAFVADCLETLEELGIRAEAAWRAAGGERLDLVPGLNARGSWADAVLRIARESTTWLDRADVPA